MATFSAAKAAARSAFASVLQQLQITLYQLPLIAVQFQLAHVQ